MVQGMNHNMTLHCIVPADCTQGTGSSLFRSDIDSGKLLIRKLLGSELIVGIMLPRDFILPSYPLPTPFLPPDKPKQNKAFNTKMPPDLI